MSTITIIFWAIGGLVASLLILGLFMRREHRVAREIIVDAPLQTVFGYLKLVRNQEKFNKWAQAGPEREIQTAGTDGTVGYRYAWSGKSASKGEKEITAITEGKCIETQIRFVKPLAVTAFFTIETEALADDRTKITWRNVSALPYPLNLMVPMVEKSLTRDMDESLGKLKHILESGYAHEAPKSTDDSPDVTA